VAVARILFALRPLQGDIKGEALASYIPAQNSSQFCAGK
jgi:hypothetical protein